jgi:hypothetical protein
MLPTQLQVTHKYTYARRKEEEQGTCGDGEIEISDKRKLLEKPSATIQTKLWA